MNIDELKRIAQEAADKTEGPWRLVNDEKYCSGFGCTPDGCPGHPAETGTYVEGAHIMLGMDDVWDDPDTYENAAAEAKFVATFNPRLVLELLEKLPPD